MLPELPVIDTPLHEMKQRLQALRNTLEQACRDLDLQLAALGTHSAVSNAPLNASRPLRSMPEALTKMPSSLFEVSPSTGLQKVAHSSPPSCVIEAAPSGKLDPKLEQATLEELNAALSQAFSQIATKRGW
jgi:hypothetical protein